jgi:CubicO group peptidase (beta-lactamase class C family)
LGCAKQSAPAAAAPSDPPAPELAPFAPTAANPERKAKLDQAAPALDAYFEAKFKESGATGFAVGVILEGELAYQRGFGVRDVESGEKVDSNTVFRIASLTKSFTALSVLKLRDEGRVTLDEPATRYLPELERLVLPTRDAPPVSLRLLLTNASGLAYDDLWGAVTFGKTDAELADLLESGVQLTTTPGTKYAYSNLGWALLGKVVERISGASYRTYVRDHILRPLGMSSTVWEARDVSPERLAIGYRRSGSELLPEARPSDGAFASAGGLYTSLRDYARYAAYQLAAYPPRDDQETGPVRRSTLREMHEGQRWVRDTNSAVARITDDGLTLGAASYGYGWLNVTSCTEEGRVQHGGFEPGYFGWVVLIPRARIGFVGLATTGPAGILSRHGVFDILRKAGLLTPPKPVAHPALLAAEAALPTLLHTWDVNLFERTFDPQSLEYSWNQQIRERFVELARAHGRCQPTGDPIIYGPLHGEVRLTCERGALRFDVLMSPATPPRIQNIDIKQELPPETRAEQAVQKLVQALNGTPQALESDLFATGIDRARSQRLFRRLAATHGTCALMRGWLEISFSPLKTERVVRYSLQCSEAPLELSLNLDESGGQVTSFAAYPPRPPDALCWQ